MTMFKVRCKNEYVVAVVVVVVGSIQAGASKHTPDDAKCVTEILGEGGTKNKEVVLGTNFNFGQLTRGVQPSPQQP